MLETSVTVKQTSMWYKLLSLPGIDAITAIGVLTLLSKRRLSTKAEGLNWAFEPLGPDLCHKNDPVW